MKAARLLPAPSQTHSSGVIGYDARIPVHMVARLWTPSRREELLAKADAPLPLSVDPAVWPSLFDDGQGRRGALAYEWEGVVGPTYPLPAGTGPFPPLWQSLASLSGHLRALPVREDERVLMAVRTVGCSCFRGANPILDLSLAEALESPGHLSLLGYDVADDSFESVLSNFGCPTPFRARRFPPEIASRLNDHGLFTDAEPALWLARRMDEDIPEHAPFVVYEICEVCGSGRSRR